MKGRSLVLFLGLSLLWSGSAYTRDDGGEKYKAPPDVVATLPKICWWLYMDDIPNTPEFNTQMEDCGGYSNHYCPGLVNMKQAEKEKDINRKLRQLNEAKANMEYTLQWTSPECSLRTPAKMNLERIKFQLDMLKWNSRKRR